MFGHVGRIVAGSATGPGARPAAEPDEAAEDEGDGDGEELRPPQGAAATVLDDPALAPDCIVSRGRVGWDEIGPESKELPF